MLLCGFDAETTGLQVNSDRIIEVGAVLWDTDRKAPLRLLSHFIYPPENVVVSEEITKITGIELIDLERWGHTPCEGFGILFDFMKDADVMVAHNGTAFDKPFLEAEAARNNLADEMPQLHWLDTSIDIPFPESIKTRKLTHLAAEHGFVNPFAHRALSDVLTMLKVLALYDINEVLRVSKEPNIILVAKIKKPWEDIAPEGRKEVDKAKARGFRWDGDRKRWLKIVKESALEAETSHGEFPVIRSEA